MTTSSNTNWILFGRMTLWTIVILSICILFKDNIENIVNAWIVNPVFNTWKDNNTLLTMGALSVPIILLYILLRKKRKGNWLKIHYDDTFLAHLVDKLKIKIYLCR